MSYEFNPDTAANELPNPYKVENLCLFIAGAVAAMCGIWLLVSVHHRLVAGVDARSMGGLGAAIVLLAAGLGLVWTACAQLRFLFGRSRPVGLAKELGATQDGGSDRADYYKETLRQNAIAYGEPRGALNGVLYTWAPDLIFAPQVIRTAAENLFRSFLSLAVTLLSFLVCWMLASSWEQAGWIGLIYAVVAAPQLLAPLVQPALPLGAAPDHGNRNPTGKLIALIVFAAIGPVIFTLVAGKLPAIGQFSANTVLAGALGCALVGCLVFGLALLRQLTAAPQAVGAARVQDVLTINAHPNKLLEELDRILMERWYRRIPNRKYSRLSPVVDQVQGQFAAEVVEETQPRPRENAVAKGLAHALGVPHFRWLAVLTLLATVLACGAALAMLVAGRALMTGEAFAVACAVALSLFSVSLFCYRAAHVLWGRFDFVSELLWVDLSGSYESAQVSIGNQFSGNVQSAKRVVNIEAMTMRLWVSEVDTVIFGKDSPRQVVGMRGVQAIADDLASALKGFGESRSMVVAPTSPEDLARSSRIGAVNHLIGGATTPMLDAKTAAAAAVLAGEVAAGKVDPWRG